MIKKRCAPVLSKENHQQWFTLFLRWAESEDIGYVLIEENPAELGQVNTPASTESATTNTSTTTMTGTFSGFGSSSRNWKKDRAKADYQLLLCTSEIDQERVAAFRTSKERWDSLKQKYERVTDYELRNLQKEFYNFELKDQSCVYISVARHGPWS